MAEPTAEPYYVPTLTNAATIMQNTNAWETTLAGLALAVAAIGKEHEPTEILEGRRPFNDLAEAAVACCDAPMIKIRGFGLLVDEKRPLGLQNGLRNAL
ncbi:MAG: hypothetical protein QGG75_13815, partial [Alphaproteobacteria bacterium]|nr:hypothetical protein [Alphaproteobacteria bacterium]